MFSEGIKKEQWYEMGKEAKHSAQMNNIAQI